jgi:hypothetical protein
MDNFGTWEDPAGSSSSASPDAAAMQFVQSILKCPTVHCAASKCRRQTDKYERGQVVVCDTCPKHVRTYLRCGKCNITIHVGCPDGGGVTRYTWTTNWKCSECSNPTISGLAADVAVARPPPDPPTDTDSHAAVTVTSHASCTSATVQYEDYDSMYSAVRALGFHVKTTNYIRKNGVVTKIISSQYWQCPACSVRVVCTAVNGEDDDSAWRVGVKPHSDSCKIGNIQQSLPDSAVDDTASSQILQHSYQLGAIKGLVQLIESLGASGAPPNSICPTSSLSHRHHRGCTPINPTYHLIT